MKPQQKLEGIVRDSETLDITLKKSTRFMLEGYDTYLLVYGAARVVNNGEYVVVRLSDECFSMDKGQCVHVQDMQIFDRQGGRLLHSYHR